MILLARKNESKRKRRLYLLWHNLLLVFGFSLDSPRLLPDVQQKPYQEEADTKSEDSPIKEIIPRHKDLQDQCQNGDQHPVENEEFFNIHDIPPLG